MLEFNHHYKETYKTSIKIIKSKLKEIYPEIKDWKSKVKVNGFNIDFYSKTLNLAVIFLDYIHFTSAKQILKDFQALNHLEEQGINYVEIPYFIELNTDSIEILFDKHIEIQRRYPHGFISKDCILPADYCSLGLERFDYILEQFRGPVAIEIMNNLQTRATDTKIPSVMPYEIMSIKQIKDFCQSMIQGEDIDTKYLNTFIEMMNHRNLTLYN